MSQQMDNLTAKQLMSTGIDPTTYMRQMQENDQSLPAVSKDFIPSDEFLMNQERMLRDPREVERRMSVGTYVPQWAMDHYARTEGHRQQSENVARVEGKHRKLQDESLRLPKYTGHELEAMPPLDLIAIARNYKIDGLTPKTPRRSIIGGIMAKQELQAEAEAEEEAALAATSGPTETDENTYSPVEAATTPKKIARAPRTPEEALEYDAQMQAAVAARAAERKDKQIQKFGVAKVIGQSDTGVSGTPEGG